MFRLRLVATVHDAGGSGRTIRVAGQNARTLAALIDAGSHGITALEVSSWALRLAHYIHILRTLHRLVIETVREDHNGPAGAGWHGRYVLRSVVSLDVDSDQTGVAAGRTNEGEAHRPWAIQQTVDAGDERNERRAGRRRDRR